MRHQRARIRRRVEQKRFNASLISCLASEFCAVHNAAYARGKDADVATYLKNLKEMCNIKLRDVFFCFGRYDGIVIFEAQNETEALRFVMDSGISIH